ncbi:recombinase family protein [uncultured Oscillibacter sp.]|uniref:recombinase family protein n=1 Tax=uncultured Oscillibacter sp. TaxID=876091 RepID=UPI00272D413B|nr:recombinase family protein [uncultured Oscillibacter sp.]
MNHQNRQESHNKIDHIFKDLLPNQGMPERPEQIALSHRMLEVMQDGGIALCDAGTGIGKTYAYLVAGTVFHNVHPSRPILVSTSSIALQKAVRDEYLPFLSMVLAADGMITEPIQAVIRKGKSHYVCDQRLERRLGQLDLSKKNWRAGNALLSLREKLDLDEAPRLSGYDRERVCVPKVCDCKLETCRYRDFLDGCDGGQYPFQICNHNLLLADAIHRGTGRPPILPDSLAIIIDEAHKLPEAARQMFGVTLRASDIQDLIHDLRREKYLLAADALADTSRLLLRKLERPHNPDRRFSEYARLLVAPNRALTVVRKQVNPLLSASTRRRMDKLASTMTLFSEGRPDMVFYLAEDTRDTVMLCATVADLTAQLQSTLWNQPRPIILTSGTLAVGSDFHRFREEAGLLEDNRVKRIRLIPATKEPQTAGRPSGRKLRVAAYCRVSTDSEDQLTSYAAQKEYYTRKIEENPEWELAGIFADRGTTGTSTKKRAEFNRMIAACKRGRIDMILTKSLSRFARNTVDCLETVRILRARGIGVRFEKEGIDTLTETGEFMITLFSGFAQAESESIRNNVIWGILKSREAGNVPFQYSKLLGYRRGADGAPEIDPAEAEVVRRIYRRFLDGASIFGIQKELERDHVPTATGVKQWSWQTIHNILLNERYIGDALLQKTYTVDCISKEVRKNNGEFPISACLLFDAAQQGRNLFLEYTDRKRLRHIIVCSQLKTF